MLKREIKVTQDGSKTLYIPDWNESYHSKHGALQEAKHVFLQHGLDHFKNKNKIHVLEYGFGTGLNGLLTYLFAENHQIKVNYTTLEKFPIRQEEITAMDFETVIANSVKDEKIPSISDTYHQIHKAPWETNCAIGNYFSLKKIQIDFRDFKSKADQYDVVFFDAFGIRVQPELWEENIFRTIYEALKPNGLLTTYAANGRTKRVLQACGFEVKKLAGPPGKREMINAWKQ